MKEWDNKKHEKALENRRQKERNKRLYLCKDIVNKETTIDEKVSKIVDDIAKNIKILKSPYENMPDLLYTVRCLKKEDIEEKLGCEITNTQMTFIRAVLLFRIKGGD